MAGKKKKYNARFPPARIKKIMQTDEDVGKIAATVPVVISRALELFLESIIAESVNRANESKAKTLSSSHIKSVIQSKPEFDFLKEQVQLVPDLNTNGAETSGIAPSEKRNSLTKPPLIATPSLPTTCPSAPEETTQASSVLSRKRSRPTTSTSAADNSDPVDPLKPKRKRGRPPKIRPLEGIEGVKPQPGLVSKPIIPTPIKPVPAAVLPVDSAVHPLSAPAVHQPKSEPTSVSSAPYSSTSNGNSAGPTASLLIEPKRHPTANGDVMAGKVAISTVTPQTASSFFQASLGAVNTVATTSSPERIINSQPSSSASATPLIYMGYKCVGSSPLATPGMVSAVGIGSHRLPSIPANLVQTLPTNKSVAPNSVSSEMEQAQLSEVDSEGSVVESIFETNTTMGLPASTRALLIRPAHTGNEVIRYNDPLHGLNLSNSHGHGNAMYNNLSPTSQPINLSTKLDST
ncbi:uncharacterized protein [Watersipora subatra]|uniref:uncharacterized protein n=1 Tax=Watersipora subatra TaxID=2589382 RepID=UPI00355B6ECC